MGLDWEVLLHQLHSGQQELCENCVITSFAQLLFFSMRLAQDSYLVRRGHGSIISFFQGLTTFALGWPHLKSIKKHSTAQCMAKHACLFFPPHSGKQMFLNTQAWVVYFWPFLNICACGWLRGLLKWGCQVQGAGDHKSILQFKLFLSVPIRFYFIAASI